MAYKKSWTATLLTIALVSAAGAQQPARPASAEPAQAAARPLVDHHQHLLSPAGAALVNRPAFPSIELPAELSRLLEERAKRWNDEAGLAPLYREGAMFVATGQGAPGWIRGRQEVSRFLARRFGAPYRLTPVWYQIRGDAADVTGFYTRGNQNIGYFTMSLARGKDGVWQIVVETPIFPGPTVEPVVDAAKLVALLDAAGIGKAVVLSDAYYFDTPAQAGPDARDRVRAENDWTAAEVARFPSRLVAFCSFSPLADYAVAELERCAGNPVFKGLKLHFNSSGVDVRNPDHVQKVRRVFEAANRLKVPILAHVSAGPGYGREQVEILLADLVTAAPDIPVVIAHLWGGGGFSETALAAFAEAVAAGKPGTRNLFFEVAQASMIVGGSPTDVQKVVARMRQIGLQRIFYGSDGPQFGGMPPREAWADFRSRMPLSEEEFRQITANVAPFLR